MGGTCTTHGKDEGSYKNLAKNLKVGCHLEN